MSTRGIVAFSMFYTVINHGFLTNKSASPGHRLSALSINLLVVYRESVNLIAYITRRLSADSLQL